MPTIDIEGELCLFCPNGVLDVVLAVLGFYSDLTFLRKDKVVAVYNQGMDVTFVPAAATFSKGFGDQLASKNLGDLLPEEGILYQLPIRSNIPS